MNKKNIKQMKWPCTIEGKINTQCGRTRRCNRVFDGAGDVYKAAREELSKRRDNGSPWYGDAVTVVTPIGQKLLVDIPWPEL